MAITADNQSTTSGGNVSSPHSWTHVVNATSTVVLFIYLSGATDTMTGVTLGGVSMTRLDTSSASGGGIITSWILENVAAGTVTIAASFSNSGTPNMDAMALSYAGCAATGQPDSHATGTSAGTPAIPATTTVADQAWLIAAGVSANNGTETASTGATQRASIQVWFRAFDSNAGLAAGSNSLQFTYTGGGAVAWNVVSLAPSGGGGATSPFPPFFPQQQTIWNM